MSSLVPGSYWNPVLETRPRYWREHSVLLLLVVTYLATGYAVDWGGVVPGMMGRMNYALGYLITPIITILTLPLALVVRFGTILHLAGRELGRLTWADWPLAWRKCWAELLNGPRVRSVITVAVAFPVFLTAFGNWKSAIPVLQPFAWDGAFREFDEVIHFGHQPWALLQPILGTPAVTNWIDYFYGWWILLVPVVLSWQAWSGRWELRRRFLIACTLVWVLLGTVGAIALSSAGPCFFGRLTGDGEAYRPMLEYLRAVDTTHGLFAVQTQELLWEVYLRTSDNPFLRISAMPSIHVAFAGLCAILAWSTNRWLGIVFTGYALLVLVGSVHLGWHYALDGYVSLVALVPIWWTAGKLGAWVPRSRLGPRAGRHGRDTPSTPLNR